MEQALSLIQDGPVRSRNEAISRMRTLIPTLTPTSIPEEGHLLLEAFEELNAQSQMDQGSYLHFANGLRTIYNADHRRGSVAATSALPDLTGVGDMTEIAQTRARSLILGGAVTSRDDAMIRVLRLIPTLRPRTDVYPLLDALGELNAQSHMDEGSYLYFADALQTIYNPDHRRGSVAATSALPDLTRARTSVVPHVGLASTDPRIHDDVYIDTARSNLLTAARELALRDPISSHADLELYELSEALREVAREIGSGLISLRGSELMARLRPRR
jgi:hypothetical protein